MEEMSIYAVKVQVKELLAEYLRRVLLEKPTDPVQFLIQQIKERPFLPQPPEEASDLRSEEEKARYLDLRRDETKMALLKELFDKFASEKRCVSRSTLLVAFQADRTLLLERFPKHRHTFPKFLELIDCGNKEGELTWKSFSTGMMACLASPGSAS